LTRHYNTIVSASKQQNHWPVTKKDNEVIRASLGHSIEMPHGQEQWWCQPLEPARAKVSIKSDDG